MTWQSCKDATTDLSPVQTFRWPGGRRCVLLMKLSKDWPCHHWLLTGRFRYSLEAGSVVETSFSHIPPYFFVFPPSGRQLHINEIMLTELLNLGTHIKKKKKKKKKNLQEGIAVLYSRTSMARTSFGPQKIVRDMGGSSHWGLIIVPSQEANGDNLGIFFRCSTQ